MKYCTLCDRSIFDGEWYLKCTPNVPGLDPTIVCPGCLGDLFPRTGAMHSRVTPFPNSVVSEFGSKSDRTVGIEFEGNWDPASIILWRLLGCDVKDDGSLRGFNAAEIVTPVYTESTYSRLLDFCPLEKVDTYSRCGIHIWLGAKDHSWLDANKMLFYCAQHQQDFVKMLPETRTPFADRDVGGRPMSLKRWDKKVYMTKQGFLRSLYGLIGDDLHDPRFRNEYRKYPHLMGPASHARKTPSRMEASKRCNDQNAVAYPGPANRTWWFNMHAYWFKRCYEIRLLHTTPSTQILKAWIELWLTLCDAVPTLTLKQLKEVPPIELAPTLTRKVLIEPFFNDVPDPVQDPEQTRDEVDKLLNQSVATYIRDVRRTCPYIWTVGDRAMGQNAFTGEQVREIQQFFDVRREKANRETAELIEQEKAEWATDPQNQPVEGPQPVEEPQPVEGPRPFDRPIQIPIGDLIHRDEEEEENPEPVELDPDEARREAQADANTTAWGEVVTAEVQRRAVEQAVEQAAERAAERAEAQAAARVDRLVGLTMPDGFPRVPEPPRPRRVRVRRPPTRRRN